MKLFAKIDGGKVINIQLAGDVAAYQALYPQFDTKSWVIKTVPDGTLAGATDNNDGSFSNPPEPPASVGPPKILSKTAFQDLAISALNGGTVGMARFTVIMDATRDSIDPVVRFCFSRYEAAITFEKTNVASLTAIMANDTTNGHLTADERTAILTAWKNT